MPGPTPYYPLEFKEAVEFYRSSEKSIPKMVRELGIADEPLTSTNNLRPGHRESSLRRP